MYSLFFRETILISCLCDYQIYNYIQYPLSPLSLAFSHLWKFISILTFSFTFDIVQHYSDAYMCIFVKYHIYDFLKVFLFTIQSAECSAYASVDEISFSKMNQPQGKSIKLNLCIEIICINVYFGTDYMLKLFFVIFCPFFSILDFGSSQHSG